jgi:hypothetical protein
MPDASAVRAESVEAWMAEINDCRRPDGFALNPSGAIPVGYCALRELNF